MTKRVTLLLLAGLAVVPAGACSSTDDASSATTTTTPATTAPPGTGATSLPTRTSMRGDRYCEVLLVRPVDGKITADVYNTWPLNDCPAEEWSKLDATRIAADNGAQVALLNGPRYWLMDTVEKDGGTSVPKATFGSLEMYRQASVEVGPLAEAMAPYRPHPVDRKAAFTFGAGSTVFELHDDQGRTWLMQTWSQMVDTGLTEGDLAGLGSRLKLPAGWTFTTRTLDRTLRIDTTGVAAQVLMDDLRNSYSLVSQS